MVSEDNKGETLQQENLQEKVAQATEVAGATTTGETTSAQTEEHLPVVPRSSTSYADAIAKVEQEPTSDLPTFVGFEQSGSIRKGSFIPSADINRKVAVYSSGPDGVVAKFTRASDKPTEGITLYSGQIRDTFNVRMFSIPPKTQVTLVFKEGNAYGYLMNEKKIYIPEKQWPQELELPKVRKVVKHRIKAVIVG